MSNKKETIAILYFCTWTYSRYRDLFFTSSEKYFFSKDNDIDKHYYIRTDDKKLLSLQIKNVTFIYQKALWRPDQTLYRFRIFLSQKTLLEKHDYIVFFNANFQFKDFIFKKDFLPTENKNYMALLHFSYYNKINDTFPYDRNPDSKAYIPYWSWKNYYLWALNWGKTFDFLELCKTCDKRIQQDYENNISAIRYDESMLNKFFLDRTDVKNLDLSYWYPEAWWFPQFPVKIMSRSKEIFIWSKDKLRSSKMPKISILKIIYIKSIYVTTRIIYSLFYSLFHK